MLGLMDLSEEFYHYHVEESRFKKYFDLLYILTLHTFR